MCFNSFYTLGYLNQNDKEQLINSLKIYYNKASMQEQLDGLNGFPNRFSVGFKKFNKTFSHEFVKIKKGNEYPIGSEDVYVLGNNGQPTHYMLKKNEVNYY